MSWIDVVEKVLDGLARRSYYGSLLALAPRLPGAALLIAQPPAIDRL